jgi:hypothetical protein
MKSRILKAFSVMAAVALVAAFVTVAMPVQVASAGHAHFENLRQRDTQTTPITVVNATPSMVISAFAGTGTGNLESATPGAADGKPLQIFVPVGAQTSIYAWDSNGGYRLLGTVAPANSDDKTTLDAAK